MFCARDGRYCRAASNHCAATTLASLALYFSSRLPACSSEIKSMQGLRDCAALTGLFCARYVRVLACSTGPLHGHQTGLAGIVLQQQDPCMQLCGQQASLSPCTTHEGPLCQGWQVLAHGLEPLASLALHFRIRLPACRPRQYDDALVRGWLCNCQAFDAMLYLLCQQQCHRGMSVWEFQMAWGQD